MSTSTQTINLRAVKAYGFAGLSVGVALLITITIPAARHRSPYLLPMLGIMLGASWGLGPGIFATLLGMVSELYFFVPQPLSFVVSEPEELVPLLLFGTVGLSITWITHSLHLSRVRAQVADQTRVEAQRLTNMVLESISDGFKVLDREWRYTYVNTAGAKMLGKTPVDLLGKNFWQEWPAALRTRESFQSAMTSYDPAQFEVFYPEPLNRWYHVRCYPSPNGLSLFFHDFTERKQTEEALEKQRQWLRVTLNSIGDAVLATDADGKITILNPVGAALTGVTESEVIGQPAQNVFQIVDEQTGEKSEDIIGRVLKEAARALLGNHTALVSRDGREIPIEHSVAPIQDSAGNVLGVVLVFHDVAEKRRAEETLRESRDRENARAAELQAIMDAMPVATFISRDRECRNIIGSRTTEELLRLPPGSDLSKSVPDDPKSNTFRFMKNGKEIPPHELPMQRASATGNSIYNYEMEVLFEDGSRRNLLGNAVPLLDNDGLPRGVVGGFIDITELKRSEERLREAQKLESLGLLAGGLAHDFNNLLVGVIGSASLAQTMLPPDSPVVRQLDRILKTGEQLAHLTRQMLAYSGKGRFFLERIILSDLIPEISGLVQPSIPKKIEVRLELERGLPPIEADRGQMQQVVMNLVLNAAEAIGSETGLITVKTGIHEVDDWNTAELPVGTYVYLEVRDTGQGMNEETKAKIFDPFFSTKFVGRGLGLAAVSGIVRGHKGTIRVTSALGKGTTFTVLFPVAEGTVPVAPVNAGETDLVGSGTVLVVDDEETVRDVAKHTLERFGYHVLLADSGPAAIDIFKRHPGDIALVILDLSMPGMGGEEALPELRKIRSNVKVLVSSGYNAAEMMRMFTGQRISGIIQKPFTSILLAEKVKSVMG